VTAFERMNGVIAYIENNITGEIDYSIAAEFACCPINQFQRFFSYITEISLSDYIRKRRLSLCAFEIQNSKSKIIDVAVKYGYDSHASFTRAFREFHGISPSKARSKGAVLNVYPRLFFQNQNFETDRGKNKMAVLGHIEFVKLPEVRMIGIKVINGGGKNPVPALWDKCFRENAFHVLDLTKPIVDYWVGWMGEYNQDNGTWTYIAGLMMPFGTPVPEGFDYRDLQQCTIGNGYINGNFANGDVFRHSHELTVDGIIKNGYEPDYSYGWSAEAYAKDLSFDAEEGTINYFCPCKEVSSVTYEK
jgi:AraC family transcriptional regulator